MSDAGSEAHGTLYSCNKSSSTHHFIISTAGFGFGSGHISLDGNGDDGGERPNRGRIVLLNPHQPPQNILPVAGPPVDVRVLKPTGDVTLRFTRSRRERQSRV